MTGAPAGYRVREASSRDEDRIRELLRNLIGETAVSHWTPEFYRWKHRESPFGPSYAAVACPGDGDRPVSVHHAMSWEFSTPDGERVPAARPCDGSTDPDHQRRGLYAALDRRTQDDLRRRDARLCIGTPNPKTLGMELKTGWSIAARLPSYVRPVYRPASLLGALRSTGRTDGVDAAAGLTSWTELLRRFGERRVAGLVASHENARTQVGYRTPRDLRYLEWRYAELPTVRYAVKALERGGELDGFLIARPASGARGLPVLVITEIFLATPTAAAAARLLRATARDSGAGYLLTYFAPGTVEHRALRQAGFFRLPRKRTVLTARQLLPSPLDPTNESSWDLTLGELEVF